jgi:hypothetical protein
LVALSEPKLTPSTPLKPVPVSVTVVPSASGPESGLTALTVGTRS